MKVLISREKIQRKVEELGKKISEHYADTPFTVLVILKGSFIFASDLVRNISSNRLTVDFLRLSSYSGTESSGKITAEDKRMDGFKNKHILIIEDIVDTGFTISFLKKKMESSGAASVSLCSLLEKPDVNRGKVKIDFTGFSIPDEFVVGYGLDMDEKYRNEPDILIYSEK